MTLENSPAKEISAAITRSWGILEHSHSGSDPAHDAFTLLALARAKFYVKSSLPKLFGRLDPLFLANPLQPLIDRQDLLANLYVALADSLALNWIVGRNVQHLVILITNFQLDGPIQHIVQALLVKLDVVTVLTDVKVVRERLVDATITVADVSQGHLEFPLGCVRYSGILRVSRGIIGCH